MKPEVRRLIQQSKNPPIHSSRPRSYTAGDYKIVALRELPMAQRVCDCPQLCAEYWREHIPSHPFHNVDAECLVVLMLNARKRIIGHNVVSIGTLDSVLAAPREVFRAAIIASAASVILMHNHPSGDPTPSDADVTLTRNMIRAGELVGITVMDHVVMGRATVDNKGHASLCELGYFYNRQS